MKQVRPLTRDQVRNVDRAAIEQYGIPGVVLMENAGRGTAQQIIEELRGNVEGKPITIACGGGNNGGDGCVIARHLHNAGADVTILLAARPEQLRGDAAINFRIVRAMNLPILPCATAEQVPHATTPLLTSALIVDALLGTGFSGEVRSPMKELIERINTAGRHGIKVVAVDIPSGLDCDTGQAAGAAVRASLTVTFGAPKVGLLKDGTAAHVGRIKVVDIGVPRELLDPERWGHGDTEKQPRG